MRTNETKRKPKGLRKSRQFAIRAIRHESRLTWNQLTRPGDLLRYDAREVSA